MSIFENAGSIYRASTDDQRLRLSNHGLSLLETAAKEEPEPKIEAINTSLGQIHNFAFTTLKQMGMTDNEINEGINRNESNKINDMY